MSPFKALVPALRALAFQPLGAKSTKSLVTLQTVLRVCHQIKANQAGKSFLVKLVNIFLVSLSLPIHQFEVIVHVLITVHVGRSLSYERLIC